jgi:chaperonin GroES
MMMNDPQNMSEEMPPQDIEPEDEDQEASLDKLLQGRNLAEGMDEDKLRDIGRACKQGFENDLNSRSEWEKDLRDWTNLAMQVRQAKSFPWVDCSNVQYPILSTAAMQFAARAYPSLVPSDGKIVKSVILGKDPTEEKLNLADRVSTYMSWQIMHDMDEWEEDMDRLLLMLPIAGTVFKKTYWDKAKEKVASRLVLPMNLVVDNWCRSLDEAERISEIIPMTERILKERQLQGIFLDIDLGSKPTPQLDINKSNTATGMMDSTVPYTLIEQHCFLDLDDDKYGEPYTVTFHRESSKVLSIQSRFRTEDVTEKEGKLLSIKPLQYYTKFSFVPNPDGSFYAIGFGRLLGPLNEAVNTLINQLIDGGTMSTLQSGFIGKGLRLRAGTTSFAPGEWKPVNATGDDLRKQIVPLPAKEPSKVLFELMANLVSASKELASVAEIFVGKMPGQNTPATTTMATIEQGMKVFTAVYKRIYRALASEFYKIFELNETYVNPQTYVAVLDMEVGPKDFDDKSYDICPGADPNAMSQTEKLQKAQGLMELLPLGALDPVKVVKRMLQAQEQPNWEELFANDVKQTGALPPPPPDPKLQEMQMKGALEEKKIALKGQETQHKMQLEERSQQTQMQMKQQEHAMAMQNKAQEAQLDGAVAIHKQKIFSAQEQQKMNMAQVQHQQDLSNSKEQSSSKVQAIKAQAAAKPKTNSKAGKAKT